MKLLVLFALLIAPHICNANDVGSSCQSIFKPQVNPKIISLILSVQKQNDIERVVRKIDRQLKWQRLKNFQWNALSPSALTEDALIREVIRHNLNEGNLKNIQSRWKKITSSRAFQFLMNPISLALDIKDETLPASLAQDIATNGIRAHADDLENFRNYQTEVVYKKYFSKYVHGILLTVFVAVSPVISGEIKQDINQSQIDHINASLDTADKNLDDLDKLLEQSGFYTKSEPTPAQE